MTDQVLTIDHYRVLARIGRGGMGEVYRAVDERLGREVAIKLLPLGLGLSEGKRERREVRLLREARAASALNHPNIVTLFDVGTWADRLYLVMELIEGERFSDLAARGISPDEALGLVADAADALFAAHQRGILHRDVKSDNLMLANDGRVKVVDFGLAKLAQGSPRRTSGAALRTPRRSDETVSDAGDGFDDVPASGTLVSPPERTPPPPSASAVITGTDQLLGTPAYMAPEQFEGMEADAQTEVFSLGVVLYELLCGQRPWSSPFDATTHATPARAPSELAIGRGIRASVDAVALRALNRSRTERFHDMAAFAEAARAARSRAGSRFGRLVWVVPAVVGVPIVAAAAFAVAPSGSTPASNAAPARAAVRVDRSSRLTFEGGCDEQPSFSPDGRSVVFDAAVHDAPGRSDYAIVAIDVETGAQRRLTHGRGRDYAPAVSPDGSRVVYAHRGPDAFEFRVVPIEGDERAAPLALGPATGRAAWTPSGEILTSDGASHIVARSLGDSKPAARATLPEGGNAQAIAIAPGGALFAVVRKNGMDRAPRLFAIEPGAEPHLLADEGVSTSAVVATDRAVYFARHEGASNANVLVRRDRDTGATEIVLGAAMGAGFDVSKDGRRLVYSTCVQWSSPSRLPATAPPSELWPRRDWDDFALRRVGAHHLVFTSTRVGAHQVWITDLGTGKDRAIGGRGSYGGSASADGTRLVFSEPDGLRVADLSGAAPRKLTDGSSDSDAQFTSDGSHVVFLRAGAGGARVHVVGLEGGGQRAIGEAGVRGLAVSPSEPKFVVLRGPSGAVQAFVGGLDGGDLVLVPSLPPGDYMSPRMSSDGHKLLVVRGTEQVLEVDLEGGGTPESRFSAAPDAIADADYAPDGNGLVGTVVKRSGDLWLLQGEFR